MHDSSEGRFVELTLVAVSVFRATAGSSDGVLHVFVGLVYTKMRSVLIDFNYALWMVLYAFSEFVLYWIVTNFCEIAFVLNCLVFFQRCIASSFFILDASLAE